MLQERRKLSKKGKGRNVMLRWLNVERAKVWSWPSMEAMLSPPLRARTTL